MDSRITYVRFKMVTFTKITRVLSRMGMFLSLSPYAKFTHMTLDEVPRFLLNIMDGNTLQFFFRSLDIGKPTNFF